jgi:hypothetical protein
MATLTIDRHPSGVATLTMSRPEVFNAFDETMIAEMDSAFATLMDDGAVRIIVLAGAGKHFSAGADLQWMRRASEASFEWNVNDARRFATMLARKDDVVKQNTTGIEFLFKKNKVTYIKGTGKIAKAVTGAHQVAVKGLDGTDATYTAKYVVIATGSEVTPLPGITIDEKQIVSSTGALTLAKVPKSMVVIGGGVIGLEMGSVWRRLGATVTVVEFLDFIMPPMDGEVRKQMQRILEKQGMKFMLGQKVTKAVPGKDGVTLTVEPAKGGAATEMKADVVLVAVGKLQVGGGSARGSARMCGFRGLTNNIIKTKKESVDVEWIPYLAKPVLLLT